MPIAGESAYEQRAHDAAAVTRAVARPGADGVIIGADVLPRGNRIVQALRAGLGPRGTLMAGFPL